VSPAAKFAHLTRYLLKEEKHLLLGGQGIWCIRIGTEGACRMLITALVTPVMIPIAALLLVLALAKLERVLLDGGDQPIPVGDEQGGSAEGAPS
jgi:hypothetical protein